MNTDPEVEIARAPACPAVTKAEAWVNRMPGIGEAPTKLVVVLGIDSEVPWMLAPVDSEGAFALELKPGGNSVAGTVAYRQAQPAPLPKAIRIVCQGSEVARIDKILIVQ